jgi:predicted lipoprotein with Yx(FWY)xxD motif
MRSSALLLVLAAVAIAGCGDDDDASRAGGEHQAATREADPTRTDHATTEEKPATGKRGATITLQDSDFGPMLFDSRKQAIYAFERDRRDESVCYGGCAEAWPPVFTDGPPRAGAGVREALLGTINRDGRAQVTYAGRPLYFYAHEDAGVVLCHNVNLNGGYWWAIGADGRRRPSS